MCVCMSKTVRTEGVFFLLWKKEIKMGLVGCASMHPSIYILQLEVTRVAGAAWELACFLLLYCKRRELGCFPWKRQAVVGSCMW